MSPDGRLLLDSLMVGQVSTRATNSLVTDSAAGATAYACGLKTFNGAVAVKEDGKACGTLLEAAKKAGMRTGVVVTSELTHATPASFSSHSVTREDYAFIGQQMLKQGLDVAFGGGADIFKQNGMWEYAQSHSMVITKREHLKWNNLTRPIFGAFAPSHLAYSIDQAHDEPTLTEMTETALNMLTNKNGFFLLIEGSRIDHACHDNDVAAMVQDVLAFDKALRVIVKFAKEHENTLVVVVADHETGGLTIGNGAYRYNDTALRLIKASAEHIATNVTLPYTKHGAILAVKRYAEGLWAEEDEAYFDGVGSRTTKDGLKTIILNYFNRKTETGWTTSKHTGVDVPLFAFGMGSSHFVGGIHSNDEIGRRIAAIMKFDLEKLTYELAKVPTTPSRKRDETLKDEYHTGL